MAEVEVVAQSLLVLDEDDLMAQIGARSQAIEASPSAASIDSLEEELPVPRGAFDDLLKAGRNIFAPASAQSYKILCSPIGGDSELAAELNKLMNEKTAEAAGKMAAALTPVLVGSLGLPQSIAVMVGSLIVKKVAKGTSDFICENWKVTLEGSVSPSETTPESSPIAPSEPSAGA
ncbi:hypothetical protein C7B61_20660 [filamentous cyanobacterium CCP1]|nr:hypothetical protein C7B76_09215 [filamentous cyanobacterium CCP2]PSB56314.1 hypothetical protein C7B61_20660 [filamentous cyanobacterium CCP1]